MRSRNALVLGVALDEELERHAALEPRVAGTVDLAHAPAPDQLFDLVPGDDVAWCDVPVNRHRSPYAARCSLTELLVECNAGGRTVAPARPPRYARYPSFRCPR